MKTSTAIDPDAYWNIISDKASRDAFEKDNPFETRLLSVENREAGLNIRTYAEDHREEFLKLLQVLTPERKEIAIEYLILRKTETQIATMHGRKSQSMLGQEINAIVRLLGASIVLGSRPSIETIRQILDVEGIQHADFARIIFAYAECGTLSGAARKTRLKRAQIRRGLREVQARLARSKNLRAIVCAEYVKGLLGQWNCSHPPRKRVFSDPAILGRFDIDVTSPSASSVFTARAEQGSNRHHAGKAGKRNAAQV